MATKLNVYEMVTDRILAELEKGNIPWHKPWIRPTCSTTYSNVKVEVDPKTCAYSRSTGRPYSLLNQMLLCRSGEWATYKQIQEAGGWKTDNIMKTVYQHAMDMDTAKKNMADNIGGLFS